MKKLIKRLEKLAVKIHELEIAAEEERRQHTTRDNYSAHALTVMEDELTKVKIINKTYAGLLDQILVGTMNGETRMIDLALQEWGGGDWKSKSSS